MNTISSVERARWAPPEWRDLAAFLRAPRAPERATGPNGRALGALGQLFALDAALMLALMALAGLAVMLGAEFPESALESLEWTPGTIALVVVVAPLLEETLFRSPLSGRPGHLLAWALFTAGFLASQALSPASALGAAAGGAGGEGVPPGAQLGAVLLLAGGLGALLSVFVLRGRPPVSGWPRLLPLAFWLSAVLFASIHLWNYPEGQFLYLLPLVLPQLLAGTIFGYARVRYGLWASVLLHALHNGAAVGAIILAERMMA